MYDGVLEYMTDLPLLASLNLSGCYRISDDGLVNLQAVRLTSLDLDQCCKVTDGGLQYLRDMPLEFLSVNGCPLLTDACLWVLLSLPKLSYVSMIACRGISYWGSDQFGMKGVHCER